MCVHNVGDGGSGERQEDEEAKQGGGLRMRSGGGETRGWEEEGGMKGTKMTRGKSYRNEGK